MGPIYAKNRIQGILLRRGRSHMLSHAPHPVTFIEKSCTKCSNTAQYEAVYAEILHQMQQSQR